MFYEVTANRKRPQNFESLIGQEFAVSTLKNAITTGRIAHAYLFAGPRGVGKTSAARVLAKALNCETGPTPEPCGQCSNCLEIQKASSMDVIEIDGASNTSVNDIRQIKDEVLFAPGSSKYKIYIIDEVHMLSNSAFNALLKTIEEPPHYVIFIFATTEIHKVPATIRSRCQQFNFRLISTERIASQLKQVCDENNLNYDEEALFWVAKEGNGSMRDSYTLFDQVLSFSGDYISYEKISSELGLVGLDRINNLAEMIAAGDRKTVLEEAGKILLSGIAIEQFIIDLAEYYRNILFIKSGITSRVVLGYNTERFSQTIVQNYSEHQLEEAVGMILTIYKNIKISINQRYEFELLLSKLCSLNDKLSNEMLVNQIRELKSAVFGNSSAALQTQQVKPAQDVKSFKTPEPQTAQPAPTTQTQPAAENNSTETYSLSQALQQELKKKAVINENNQNNFDKKIETFAEDKVQIKPQQPAQQFQPQPVRTETQINTAFPQGQQAETPTFNNTAAFESAEEEEPSFDEINSAFSSFSERPLAQPVMPAEEPSNREQIQQNPFTTQETIQTQQVTTQSTNLNSNSNIQDNSTAEPQEQQSTVAPAALANLNADIIFDSLKDSLKREQPVILAALEQAVSARLEGSELKLLFNSTYHAESIENEVKFLKEKLYSLFHINFTFSIAINQNFTNNKENKPEEQLDSNIQLIKQIFRGEILE